MSMEIYCSKKIKCELEHAFWIMKLGSHRLSADSDYYVVNGFNNPFTPFELDYIYNSKKRTLTWGGWSVKRRKGFQSWEGFENTPLNTMKGKSRSKKKLLNVLPLWETGDKPECQAAWLEHWDDNTYWSLA